jgi:hypothetical protein
MDSINDPRFKDILLDPKFSIQNKNKSKVLK